MTNPSGLFVLQFAALVALALAIYLGWKTPGHAGVRIWQWLLFASLVLGLIASLNMGGVLTLSVSILSFVFALIALVAVVISLKQRGR